MQPSSSPSRLVVDPLLARRLELAQAAQNRGATPPSGVLQVAGGLALFNGPDSPLTQALALGLEEPVSAEDLDRVESHLGQGGGVLQIDLLPFAHHTLAQGLAQRGYQVGEFQQVLVRELPGSPTPPTVAEVRPLRPGEAEVFSRTVAQGFLGREEVSDAEASLMLGTASMSGTTCFLALVDGEPAGGGTVALHDGVATLSGTGVRERFRGRGLQQELIAARLAWALRQGCTLAASSTLPASASQRNMERMGFFIAYPKVVMMRQRS
ncbi:GNAT family N-acetyltransferase [Myxococcus sp. CA051A]|uniref:GNAT family N-acetyltransferase n=1 Tax=unclassified Myxococcus TaxID=2648731 RepID=UPI00157AF4FA|nr:MULTISPECIES: GNAT family N-acetyltransferase [unclassified Myxococcus]NTX35918.1 GNAT family N-acetyltransferase [Myxococcus sp. CA033]NTX63645.1 GNAT family N-acetyltransferase [Myxococcus sp. CA051A]